MSHHGVQQFLGQIARTSAHLEPLSKADLIRAHAIMVTYADAEMDLVDCCIMAMSEWLNIEEIATFDRRDFGMFRPKHCDYLTLLP
jgi:predicted nucleic acid-binding protein